MRIAYENKIDELSAASIVATNTDANYPVTNMQDQRLSVQWSSGTAATQYITVSFDRPRKINTVGILGHNIDLAYFQNVQRLGSETEVLSLCALGGYLGSYAGLAGTATGGKVYRTFDAGSTWSLIGQLGTEQYVPAITVLDSGNIVAGTIPTGYVYRSQDNGSSFTQIQRLGAETGVYCFSYLNSSTCLAGTGHTAQIYKSTDNGSSWTNITRLGSEQYVLSMVYLGSNIIVAGTYPSGYIYRSTDNGSSWSAIGQLGSETGIYSLASLGSGIVLAGTRGSGNIYRSTDYGSSWSLVQRLGAETYGHALVHIGSGVVLAGTTPDGEIWRSTDYGSSFTRIMRLGTEAHIYSLAHLGSGIVVAGTGETGQIYRSITYLKVDAGSTGTWTAPSLTQTLTWNEGAILNFPGDQYYQYWRFTIDNRSNQDGTIQIGRLWLGEYMTVSPSSLIDFKVTKKRSDTVLYGKDRQKFAVPGVGWRRFELSFPASNYDMVKQIEDMYDTVGNHSSIIFANFDDIRTFEIVEPCYVSIDGDLQFTHRGNMRFEYQLQLEEDL